MYSVQLNFCKVWYSLGWVRLWCLTPLPTPWFLPVDPPVQNFFKISNFMYTSRIYQNYCSVTYIYRDIHDFMFPFFKLISLQNIFSHHASQLWKLTHSFINFWDPKGKYFLTLSHSCNINYDFEKYSSIILATICQSFRHFNPSVCIPKYPFVYFWHPIHNYFFSLTDSCNINYKHKKKKNYSIILGIICPCLRKLYPSEHKPEYQFINFWDPKGKYFLMLSHSCNINYDFEKYSSIILATICQRFRPFNPSVCIPKYPFVNFWDPIHN